MKHKPMNENVEIAVTQKPVERAPDLLLRHCLALGGTSEPKEPARIRLEEMLGPELASRLLSALTPQPRP